MKLLLRLVPALVAFALVSVSTGVRAADEGWRITSFEAVYQIDTTATLHVTETIQADFGAQRKHGIFRFLYERQPCASAAPGIQPPIAECPEGSDRVYKIGAIRVTDANSKPLKYSESTEGDSKVIKIGDPDVLVTGAQTYVISYQVTGALDAYDDHDELYWNASGEWPVAIERFSLSLALPDGASVKTRCFQGVASTDSCLVASSGPTATFEATRRLADGEQVTIVAGWQKGLFLIPPPLIETPKTVADFFTFDAIELAGLAVVALATVALLSVTWWRNGRDRRFKTLYYLTNNPAQHTKPLFARSDVVVEFLPPDGLRPAQMGVILDESADTLDVTATIVDLAVRGYLHITEIPKEGLFGKTDWELTRIERDSDLQPYEEKLLDGLFEDGEKVKMSDLKNKFVTRLNQVEKLLYKDAMKRKWFTASPEKSRTMWAVVAIGVAAIGVAAAFGSGYFLGRALIPAPLVLGGLVLLILSRAMGRRTALGSEALRRVLGFRLYISTAETRQQEFNEQQNIFARYLPFAIVFGCVGKWAKAFEGLDHQARESTQSWYTSSRPFQVAAFSSGLQGFASSVSSTISSSPSSSGGSGFSGGGSSGGGGGGGGGGSW